MKKMRVLLGVLSLTTWAQASADLLIYKCTYTIERAGKAEFKMSGNIVANDVAGEKYDATYLTLAPNQVSGVELEARILITSDGYNPITLHKPGNSATTLASGDLGAQGGQVSYVDDAGSQYQVTCTLR